MDNITQPLNTYNLISSAPTHLWIGSPELVHSQVLRALHNVLCTIVQCQQTCVHTHQLANEQHPYVLFLKPTRTYTREHIEILHKVCSYKLEENTKFYCVIYQADALGHAAASSILKLLEEPPVGYNFILVAQRSESILPTIRSRCIISTYQAYTTHCSDALCLNMSTQFTGDPLQFMQTLEKLEIDEISSLTYLDHIFSFWQSKCMTAYNNSDQVALKSYNLACSLLLFHIKNPPAPGSAVLMWKNIFLQMSLLIKPANQATV
ncbi:hypothetical protein KG892_02010 [Vermiphilus pyriformis]|nr:MAG: hypothetical protein KG892_02010 [Vermiphilus pyriformis]